MREQHTSVFAVFVCTRMGAHEKCRCFAFNTGYHIGPIDTPRFLITVGKATVSQEGDKIEREGKGALKMPRKKPS